MFQSILGGHGWTFTQIMVGFHADSNIVNVSLRPMTGAELAIEITGYDWLENRVHVIRGGRRTYGAVEVQVNGNQRLDDDVGTGICVSRNKESPELRSDTYLKRSKSQFDDSGVSLGRRLSPHGGEGDDVPRLANSGRRQVDDSSGNAAAILSTPARPLIPRNLLQGTFSAFYTRNFKTRVSMSALGANSVDSDLTVEFDLDPVIDLDQVSDARDSPAY